MSFVHFRSGPCIVVWNSVELGYTEDGVRMRIEPRYADVHSDNMGGLAGVPSDTQLLGAIAIVTTLFSKYVKAELDKLTSFEKAGTAGQLPEIGTFIKQDSEYAALELRGTKEEITFDTAFLRQGQEMNVGTNAKKYAVGFECWLTSSCTRTLFAITGGYSSCVP